MRRFCLVLVGCLALAQPLHALDFSGEVLYWQATEAVDWTLDTNRQPVNQFVDYRTIGYDYAPGFRVGLRHGSDSSAGLCFTRLNVSATDSATGDLTPAFLGGKSAVPSDPFSATPYYFDRGEVYATIDYNVLDVELSKSFQVSEAVRVRPVVGLRGAWIDQAFDSTFQGAWPGDDFSRTVAERMKNDFWGIGPRVGVDTAWSLCRGDNREVSLAASFSTSYLLGGWRVSDVATSTTTLISAPEITSTLTQVFPIAARDFGALNFQASLGLHFRSGCWSGTIGYELNDWLNQCQIFDDATGPHNNDLTLQGLTAGLCFSY